MFAPFAEKHCEKTVSICDALQVFFSFEQLKEVVRSNLSAINKKEFHGNTPLHKSSLRGDPKITELLLSHGASVDEPNDYGETPFHFACKQGNVANIYTLLKNGADKTWRDALGRSGMHHAAIGGSVLAMHYLAHVLGLQYDDVDFGGVTPLHLACAQGFQDAVKYLLRKERCDVRSKDMNGNLPIHFACTTGLTETVWTLLEKGGCGMLNVENQKGQTPMTVLKEGGTRAHRYLHTEMQNWAKIVDPNKAPTGPLLSWIVMLLVPTVSFINIVFTGYLFKGLGGLVISVLTVCLCFYVMGQGHRLPHMSRWSNPLFFGAFAAGIVHTGILYTVKILPVLWSLYPNLVIISFSLAIVMLSMYVKLLLGDPGTCQVSRNSNNHLEEYMNIEHLAKGLCRPEEFCVYCEIIPPERVKHCKICERCFYDHDHHCLFLLNCVARNNHRLFVLFLLLTSVMHALFAVQASMYLYMLYPAETTWTKFAITIFFREGWVNMLIILNLLSIFWEVMVVMAQFLMISRGLTTTYHPTGWSVRYKLTTKDKLNNICNFLRGKRTFTARDLYHASTV